MPATTTTTRKPSSLEQSRTYLEQGKLPPQSLDMEVGVLGALLLDNEALLTTIDFLKPEHFYEAKHKLIYEAIAQLTKEQSKSRAGSAVDPLTVTNKLKENGVLDEIGGGAYIAQLTNRIASSANVEHYAHVIAENFIKRELIRISSDVTRKAYSETTDALETLDEAERLILEIGEHSFHKDVENIKVVLQKTFTELEEFKRSDGDKLEGAVYSGFTEVDKLTNGFQKSTLIILGARPAMGKTAFAMSIARNIAIDFKKPVVFFSLEMSSRELAMRLISSESEINSRDFKSRKLTDEEWQRLITKTAALNEAPIFIDDSPHISMFELRAKCRRLKEKHDIKMIFIDYLQLMEGDDKGGKGNREQEISRISRQLKSLARELEVPVLVLSQLNRNVEARGGKNENTKVPQLSDLRESGAIEQDADIVMFIHRPEYYGHITDEIGNDLSGKAEIYIAKHRSGQTGKATTRFIGNLTKFQNLDEFDYNDIPNGLSPNENFDKDGQSYMTVPSKMNDENYQDSGHYDNGNSNGSVPF
ncbi:replicative DNA helicase [Bacteroidia bacterium]|nr:replicative DNA helicase [Bacteroidia bacterium]